MLWENRKINEEWTWNDPLNSPAIDIARLSYSFPSICFSVFSSSSSFLWHEKQERERKKVQKGIFYWNLSKHIPFSETSGVVCFSRCWYHTALEKSHPIITYVLRNLPESFAQSEKRKSPFRNVWLMWSRNWNWLSFVKTILGFLGSSF